MLVLLPIEILRVERLRRNAGLNFLLLAEYRLARQDAPAIAIAMIKILEGNRLLQHCPVTHGDQVDVSIGVAEKAAHFRRLRSIAQTHGDVDPVIGGLRDVVELYTNVVAISAFDKVHIAAA